MPTRVAVVALVLMRLLVVPYSAGPTVGAAAQDPQGSLVWSLPIGAAGVEYATPRGEAPWGPAALRIDEEGNFLIADTAGSRVIRLDLRTGQQRTVAVHTAQTVTDVAEIGGQLFVLDTSPDPKVLRLAADGTTLDSTQIAPAVRDGVSGLTAISGEPALEIQGGAFTSNLSGGLSPVKNLDGARFSIPLPAPAGREPAYIDRSGTPIEIRVPGLLGNVGVLGAADDGDFFVLVEELSDTHVIHVDQTVRRYAPDGHLVGRARVPLAERFTYVANGVAVRRDGAVFALVPKIDHVEIVRLAFVDDLPPVLPLPEQSLDATRDARGGELPASATACRAREDMYSAAMEYVNNRTYLTSANLGGTCAGRAKPRYLGATAGTYASVPYDWGGYATVYDFNTLMSQGKQAGDVDTNSIEACSVGVDCSGFVSRVWGTARYTTSTLPGISDAILTSQLQRGDILNRANDHVAMIDAVVSNGVNTIEATMYNSYDRVVNIYNGWGRFNGYSAYRYKEVCSTQVPVASTLLSPANGSTFSSSSVTFRWDTGTLIAEHFLYVGNAVGANDIFGQSLGTNLSATVANLPTDGRPLFVRLWSRTGSDWLTRDYAFTAWRAPVVCTSFSISPSSANPVAAAGRQQMAITALPSGCSGGSWTAIGNGSWLSVTPASGTGDGTATVSWTQNVATSPRSGVATIAGRTFSVTQAGAAPPACSFSLSVHSASPSSSAGAQSVSVIAAPSGCVGDWTASTTDSWLTVSPAAGTGSGSVSLAWAANTSRSSRSGSAVIAGSTFAVTQARPPALVPGDFDGDGRTDIAVYKTTSGVWSTLSSSANYAAATNVRWGGNGYAPVSGDFDGDGRADRAVYQAATGWWFVLLSGANFTTSMALNVGGPGWTPVPGDYDGDGRTDFVVYNTATGLWYGLKSSTGYTTTIAIGFGGASYAAVPGDFDGDGRTDIAVYQATSGWWFVLLSSTNYTSSVAKNVGGTGWIPVAGDYDGDGKADFVVYNATTGLWYGLKSGSNYTTTINISWGGTGYVPVKGDYDGDGRADLVAYQQSTGWWYILLSGSSYTTTLVKNWGGTGYTAIPQ